MARKFSGIIATLLCSYYINGQTGDMIWTINGNAPPYQWVSVGNLRFLTWGNGAAFAYPPDAKLARNNNTITIFDNGWNGFTVHPSRRCNSIEGDSIAS